MEITEVKVFPIQEEKLKAFVSIVFDQCFMVNDIKIIQGRDGLFISMPSRKKKNGEFKDVAHPLNNETRRMIEDKVLGEYEHVLAERGESLPAPLAAAPPFAASSALASMPAELGEPASSMAAAATPAGAASTPAAAAGAPAANAPRDATAAAAASPVAAHAETPALPATPTSPSSPPPSAVVSPPPPPPPPPTSSQAPPAGEKTLEEIEEMHLRDSFWTVT
jgi:stage V sporulation protein G